MKSPTDLKRRASWLSRRGAVFKAYAGVDLRYREPFRAEGL
jgi:hypothetical protein